MLQKGNDKKIILVVDDDTTSLKLAQKILEQDYRVALANNGELVFTYLEKTYNK